MLIGLTGRSGAGKSTVAMLFEKAGYRIIDCDALVHSLYEDMRYAALIAETFGNEYLADGKVDRKKLGALVFADKNALRKLNETVSPFILSCVTEHIEKAKAEGVPTVLDAPLLFEYGLERHCDTVVGVVCDMETAVRRLAARDGKNETELRARLASQHDAGFFRIHCDYILENNGDAGELARAFYDMEGKLLIRF
ncbi:MAG: dephospho-CoA kinase [Clostridia bacterium]|nr:dephospho-CoA kinase [Clostridia bacterium]